MNKNNIAQLVHDIRNPLNAISMNAELCQLLLSKEQVDIATLIKLTSIIEKQCIQCDQILTKLIVSE